MTGVSAAAPFTEGDLRVGRVFNRTTAVFSRNFLTFFVVTAVAALPNAILSETTRQSASVGGVALMGFLTLTLEMLSTAIVLYGAFQSMRGRRVDLRESLRVGFRRVIPIVGLSILISTAVVLASLLLIVPGLILLTAWFVATPACVVERLGPLSSLSRSSELTKGHRWAIFGMVLLVLIGGVIVGAIIDTLLPLAGSAILNVAGNLIWNGAWGAFYAIFVVVTYHDLRVAKEGVDIHQIAAVFD